MTYHLHGVLLPSGDQTDMWVVGDHVTYKAQPDAVTLCETGWIMPGLVDAHCHIGLAAGGAVSREEAEAQARTDLHSGVTLVRDAGAPIDTHWLDDVEESPRIIRAGRHIARPRRYIRGFGVEVEPDGLVDEVRRQARAGDGWVKLVGDWIDRSVGDLTPLWPADIARDAITTAHEEGARVTAHCFGEESVAQLVRAGIDCIEHGSGLDQATMDIMADRATGLVPTLDNLKIFPGIAAQAEGKYPRYAAHMARLYETRNDVVKRAIEAGVQIYAGTDAGGTRAHGTLLAEIEALAAVGGSEFALGAASWRARAWLGRPCLEEGAPADLIITQTDPRVTVDALTDITVMKGGVTYTVSEPSVQQ